MKLVLLLVLVSVAACVGALLLLITRARDKRLLLNAVRAASSDAPDGIGISVLCSGVSDPAQIENLLSPEYARYEVIVVLDGRHHVAEFAALVGRYRMIRVEWTHSGELEVEGVRSLGRSRKRHFRRLVLVDRVRGSAAGDFDAAAAVATYDYLLPVSAGQFLLPGTIERLVAELGEGLPGTLGLVQSHLGEPAALLSREAVVAAGGFGMHPLRVVPRNRRRTLWEPLLTVPFSRRRLSGRLRGLLAALLTTAFIAVSAAGWWWASAVFATLALAWAGGEYAARLADETAPSASGRLVAWRRLFKQYYGTKNFPIS